MATLSQKQMAAADDLNRGIAMVKTCWLALQHAETPEDNAAITDTLYEAQRTLESAERHLGPPPNNGSAL